MATKLTKEQELKNVGMFIHEGLFLDEVQKLEDEIASSGGSSGINSDVQAALDTKAEKQVVESLNTTVQNMEQKFDDYELTSDLTTKLALKADKSALGTASTKNTGTASGEVPLLGTGGKLAKATMATMTGEDFDESSTSSKKISAVLADFETRIAALESKS